MNKDASKLIRKDLFSGKDSSVEFDKFINEVKAMIEIEDDINSLTKPEVENH